MNRILFRCCALVAVSFLLTPSDTCAQCATNLLIALDEENQSLRVTVRTNDIHCLAGGTIFYSSMPPGAVLFERQSEMYRNWCADLRTSEDVRENRILAIEHPSATPFRLRVEVHFDTPEIYPIQLREEWVWLNPVTQRLEQYRPLPCTDNVPPSVTRYTPYCFTVCHKVYRIPLMSLPHWGEPVVQVFRGCDSLCQSPYPCTPGNLWDCVYYVYRSGTQWWLYFEYSNPVVEPVCYCVYWNRCLPANAAVHSLGAFNELTQAFEFTTFMEGDCTAGLRWEVFSFPPGANFDGTSQDCDITRDYRTRVIPAGAGGFQSGQTFRLVAYLDYDTICPRHPLDYGRTWIIENIAVDPGGGLRRLASPNCLLGGGPRVPVEMSFGEAQCFTVCHDHYYVHLITPPNSSPLVTITPGCNPPCFSPDPCVPGNPWDFVYNIERWGNEYYLHFEYSNELREPVCYCVQYDRLISHPGELFRLAALDEIHQTLDVSLWMTGPGVVSGTLEIQASPPELVIGPYNHLIPPTPEGVVIRESPAVAAGALPPGTNGFFDIFMNLMIGNEPRQERLHEPFFVDPLGMIRSWNPTRPCTGNVPPVMDAGQSACFLVCHEVYDVVLNAPPGAGQPIIEIVPGCHSLPNPQCNLAPVCEPGFPNDYIHRIYRGADNLWHLEFEYSNQLREPVCYCVSYVGILPECETHELVALDERDQQLQVNVAISPRMPDPPSEPCIVSGGVTVYSNPPGAEINPGSILFENVGDLWHTMEFMVAPGIFPPGSTFELIAHIQYVSPDYPDVWKSETVRVLSTFPPRLAIVDVGGECTGESVPPFMEPGQSACFEVCHRVYHVGLNWFLPRPPAIRIIPGCFAPPHDPCPPPPHECLPGGEWDYVYRLLPLGVSWELEFEYSNPGREPVCYCITLAEPPCLSPDSLVIFYEFSDLAVPQLHLYWNAPQFGEYSVYSTPLPNHSTIPPSPEWELETVIMGGPGLLHWVRPYIPEPGLFGYRNFVILCDCGPWLPLFEK